MSADDIVGLYERRALEWVGDRTLLAANGFAVVAERMEDPGCGGHSVWLARLLEDG